MTDPAPPPCEPCEQIEIDSAFSYHTLDLHAEIAELRARFEAIAEGLDKESAVAGMLSEMHERADTLTMAVICNLNHKIARLLRAALAPKSSAGGGGD